MVIIKKNIHIIRYGISLKFTENTILNRQKKTEEKYILNTILNRLNPYNYRRKRSPWLYWLWTPPQISMAPSGTSIGGARGHQTPPRRHLPRLRLRQVLGHRGAGGAEKAGEISAGKHRKPWEKPAKIGRHLKWNCGISDETIKTGVSTHKYDIQWIGLSWQEIMGIGFPVRCPLIQLWIQSY